MKKECRNCIYYMNGPYCDYCDLLDCSTHGYDWCFHFVEKENPDLLHEDLKKQEGLVFTLLQFFIISIIVLVFGLWIATKFPFEGLTAPESFPP